MMILMSLVYSATFSLVRPTTNFLHYESLDSSIFPKLAGTTEITDQLGERGLQETQTGVHAWNHLSFGVTKKAHYFLLVSYRSLSSPQNPSFDPNSS